MRVTIVLVAPARAENIGAAARAMKTMGFTDLRIVDSQAHLEPATRWVAHGSGDIIDNIEVFAPLPTRSTMWILPSRRQPAAGQNFITTLRPLNWFPYYRKNHAGCVMPRWFLAVRIPV